MLKGDSITRWPRLPVTDLQQIDAICDRFEAAWSTGQTSGPGVFSLRGADQCAGPFVRRSTPYRTGLSDSARRATRRAIVPRAVPRVPGHRGRGLRVRGRGGLDCDQASPIEAIGPANRQPSFPGSGLSNSRERGNRSREPISVWASPKIGKSPVMKSWASWVVAAWALSSKPDRRRSTGTWPSS